MRQEPDKMDNQIKESSYDKVLINATNKNVLQKSEMEYSDALYLKDSRTQEQVKATLDLDI